MTRRAIILSAFALALPLCAAAAGWEDLTAGAAGIDRTAAVPEPAAAPTERARTLICVDPGHPDSFNSATTMQNGTSEVHVNWLVGQKLERILKEEGFDVLMTKSTEMQSVENKQRALICNNGAALAVHLHCDTGGGRGFAVYYPARAGTFEYHHDPDNGFKGPSAQVMSGSKALASAAAQAMKASLAGSLPEHGLFDESHTAVGVSQGALTFSIFSKIPTITIEMVVLSNKNDAAFIKADAGQEKMARAIAAGIAVYNAP